jgi:hypothetical protein
MLVPPPDAPWLENGPDGYHILTGIMIPNVVRGPLVVPGTYTVQLTAGGKRLTAPLTVSADPHSAGTAASMASESRFQNEMIREVANVSDMIEHLEHVRQQLAKIEQQYGQDPAQKAVIDAGRKLSERVMAVEGELIDIYLTNGNEDLNRHPSQLYQKLTALYDKAQADLGPTASEEAVNDSLRAWIEKSNGRLRLLTNEDVSGFNELLKAHHLPIIQP